MRQRDGRLVTIRGSSAPVYGPNGELLGSVVVFQNISALKALERERDEWISIITHDLRQPATIILGYADRLAHTLPPDGTPEQRKVVDAVLTAAHNLNRMIGDLLDVSRIDTRRLTLSCQRVALPPLLRAIVERARPIRCGYPVHITIDGAIPQIQLDPSRIEQVLDNLLSNAATYGDPGTEIVVGIQRREGTSRSPSPNAVEESLPRTCPSSSPDSIARTRHRWARLAGRVCISRRGWSKPTGAGSGRRASRARPQPSPLRCRYHQRAIEEERSQNIRCIMAPALGRPAIRTSPRRRLER
jgi:signal transduction histidine kinase